MAEDATQSIPTREETASNLLRLGKCLHDYAFPPGEGIFSPRPIRFHEAERLRAEISRLEKRIESAIYENGQVLLKSALGVRGREVIDTQALRILAYVAWNTLATDRPGLTVARVANVVCMEDLTGHLEARRAIRTLINDQVLRYKESEYGGGEIFIGLKIIKYLNGPGYINIYWTRQQLDDERDQWRRQQEAPPLKKSSPSPCHAAATPSVQKPIEPQNLLTARGIYNALKDEVIAIDAPLLRFCGQMSLHMRRLEQIRKGVRPSVGPIVTLLIGSSGSGKTWMAENFARVSGLPFAISDMSGVSQASYVGLSVDECFYGLMANKTKIIDAQKGVVVWDEFDKLCAKGGGSHSSTDPQGRGIQAELLKPLEGCKLPLGSRRSNSPSFGTLDTYETCFVLAGAFDGLRELLVDGNRKSTGLGFGSAEAKSPRRDIREALVRYGFMEQIINRIGSIIFLPDLIPDQIVSIISHPETGLLARWNTFGHSFGITLDLTDEAIQHLAHWACETRGFSRSVKNVLGALMEQHIYDEKADVINIWLADVKKAIQETESSEHLGM